MRWIWLVLALVACKEAEVGDLLLTPCTGFCDGGTLSDIGVLDLGVRDAGFRDVGRRDLATEDVATERCPEGALGCGCSVDFMNGPGNCVDVGAVCQVWGDGFTPDRGTCVVPCDPESPGRGCFDTFVGGQTSRPAGLCREFCVEDEANPDQRCVFSAESGEQLVGCPVGETCVVGRNFEPYAGYCVAACHTDADCPRERPYCNPNLQPDRPRSGICSDARRTVGHRCSTIDPTRACDTSAQMPYQGELISRIYCIALVSEEGHCFEIGISGQNNCVTRGESLPCIFGGFRLPEFCLCSDDCSAFPNDCRGRSLSGSGQNCTGEVFLGNTEISFCLDVDSPPIPEWDFNPRGQGCDNEDDRWRCELGTHCVPVGNDGRSGCLRGCNADAPSPEAAGCVDGRICERINPNNMSPNGYCR